MDPEAVDSIDYRTTNSVEVLRLKVEQLLVRITELEDRNQKLQDEVEDLNCDIRILEKSVYY